MRTKQTARKSTGDTAPRKTLCGGTRRPVYYDYGRPPLQQHIVSKEPIIPDTAMNPHAAMTSDARKEVLSAPDLLVIILSQLPHSSLLRAKFVNRRWASLFEHVEIQAALFARPRPKESALYTEIYSDVLMDRFSTFWPINGEDKAVFAKSSTLNKFHSKESNETPVDESDIHCLSEMHSSEKKPLHPPQQGFADKCHYSQWRQFLIC